MSVDPATPLHERNPTSRFSDRAADYVKYRPTYPGAAIDAILEGLGDPRVLTAADVGAGTGISSRLLAARGVSVMAVEPNCAMRTAGQEQPLPGGAPRITWIAGAGERTTLDTASVELVLCAQSFHWFEPVFALREFHRILRPRGRAAFMWNVGDMRDDFTRAYREAFTLVSDEHRVQEEWHLDTSIVDKTGLFGPVRLQTFPNSQVLDLPGLLGRALSASYAPKSGPAHEVLSRLLTDLHAKFARRGEVMMRYRTDVYLADRNV